MFELRKTSDSTGTGLAPLLSRTMQGNERLLVLEVGGKYFSEKARDETRVRRRVVIDDVHDPDAALRVLASSPYAATIVHRSLRQGSGGIELARQLRRVRAPLGIVLMGSEWEPSERRRLIEEFADDCLTEDTDLADLTTLLIALERRAGRSAPPPCCLCWGSLQLDFMAGSVTIDGKEVALQPLQVRILACLIQHAGTVVTTEQLQRLIFRVARLGSTSIPRQISVLRRQLGPLRSEIRTVPGGYRLGL